jgi:hypothetical protein
VYDHRKDCRFETDAEFEREELARTMMRNKNELRNKKSFSSVTSEGEPQPLNAKQRSSKTLDFFHCDSLTIRPQKPTKNSGRAPDNQRGNAKPGDKAEEAEFTDCSALSEIKSINLRSERKAETTNYSSKHAQRTRSIFEQVAPKPKVNQATELPFALL